MRLHAPKHLDIREIRTLVDEALPHVKIRQIIQVLGGKRSLVDGGKAWIAPATTVLFYQLHDHSPSPAAVTWCCECWVLEFLGIGLGGGLCLMPTLFAASCSSSPASKKRQTPRGGHEQTPVGWRAIQTSRVSPLCADLMGLISPPVHCSKRGGIVAPIHE